MTVSRDSNVMFLKSDVALASSYAERCGLHMTDSMIEGRDV